VSRIDATFDRLRADGEKALIPYIMAGDPTWTTTRALVKELGMSGADIIELGVPFSEPVADGPTIQQAGQRALDSGDVSLRNVLRTVPELRKETDAPLVLMSYYNPIFIYGEEAFVRDAVRAGVDGVIVPDLPPEEASGLLEYGDAEGLDVIFLLAPTSAPARINLITECSKGFVYYVSLTGVTGARDTLAKDLQPILQQITQATAKPVAVGFGISTPAHARMASEWADGVLVGSAVIREMERYLEDSSGLVRAVGKFIRSLKNGMQASGG
jgi:tryptophan synthase alpha chain